MLAVKRYEKDYVEGCESQMNAQLDAWDTIETSGEFERLFFANLTIVLDAYFVHRSRGMEGKDGNPLNEVRMICHSILAHGSVFTAESTVLWQPEKSVLGLRAGDPIRLGEAQFRLLAEAYFSEIRRKFL